MQLSTFIIKVTPIFILSLLWSNFILAQNFDKNEKTRYGLTIGASQSNLSGYDGKSLNSFTGGLCMDGTLHRRIKFQTDNLYSQRGELNNDNVSDLKLSYISNSFQIEYYPIKKLNFFIGGYTDFLLSVNSETLSKSDFLFFDMGGKFGLGYDINDNLQFTTNYNFGFYDLDKSGFSNNKIKSNWVNVSIHYLFNRKK